MTPMQARVAFENAVNSVVSVPVLGHDQPDVPRTGDTWVRAELAHSDEPYEFQESGSVIQAVVMTATVYAIRDESASADVIAETIRSGITNREHEGLYIGDGLFLDEEVEGESELAIYTGLSVVFDGRYTQE